MRIGLPDGSEDRRPASVNHVLVRTAGVEPALPRETDFKSAASTGFATSARAAYLQRSRGEGQPRGTALTAFKEFCAQLDA